MICIDAQHIEMHSTDLDRIMRKGRVVMPVLALTASEIICATAQIDYDTATGELTFEVLGE